MPIFIPPLAFLTLLSAAYALVPWACENQHRMPLHAAAAVGMALTAGGALMAWRDWREAGLDRPGVDPERSGWMRLACVIGLTVSSFFALATLALWITQFIMPPCVR
jgi:hypothetical protein